MYFNIVHTGIWKRKKSREIYDKDLIIHSLLHVIDLQEYINFYQEAMNKNALPIVGKVVLKFRKDLKAFEQLTEYYLGSHVHVFTSTVSV